MSEATEYLRRGRPTENGVIYSSRANPSTGKKSGPVQIFVGKRRQPPKRKRRGDTPTKIGGNR